jgi:hypothetical protein
MYGMIAEIRWFLFVTLVGLLTSFGCGDDDPVAPVKKSSDSITIKSVTPNSGLLPGIATDFVVTVEYELVSADSGDVMIGFNTDEVGRFAMISSATALVLKGSGEHEFNVNVMPVDWGVAGDFKLYVNLSEHPRGHIWTPLATDIRVLSLN